MFCLAQEKKPKTQTEKRKGKQINIRMIEERKIDLQIKFELNNRFYTNI